MQMMMMKDCLAGLEAFACTRVGKKNNSENSEFPLSLHEKNSMEKDFVLNTQLYNGPSFEFLFDIKKACQAAFSHLFEWDGDDIQPF